MTIATIDKSNAASVPAFVFRGIALMYSPGEIYSGFTFRSESDLRDVMATYWWLAGWSVRTEVKVPGCGRIDVLAEAGSDRVVIEMKRAIRNAGEARAAYQQAHAYAAYLSDGHPDLIQTYVAAAEVSSDALALAGRAYRTVWGGEFWDIAHLAINPEFAPPGAARLARSRSETLRTLADLARGFAAEATLRQEDEVFREDGSA